MVKSRKKILLVCPSLGIGGRERIAINTVEVLRDLYDVKLAVFMRKEKEYVFDGDLVELNAYSKLGGISKIVTQLKRAMRIARYVKKHKVDLLIGFGEAANTSICLAKIFGVKRAVSIVHGFDELNNHLRMKFVLSRSDAVVCIAQEMNSELLNRYVPHCPVYTIENGYDIEDIRRKSEQNEERLLGSPAFIAMGRLESVKGYDRMLQAFSIILKHYPNAELTILGDGSKKEELIRIASELEVSEHVHFCGNRENPYCILKQASVFFLTSRNEGFPNALIEALACEVPIVSVDCRSGPKEILSRQYDGRRVEGMSFEKYGVLVENQDLTFPETYAEAVVRILNDHEKLSEYRQLALERAEEFSKANYCKKMEKMIEEVLCD
ncbi:MAG: glycosyltransferase [Lachnospiraceae bacterium]|nr:glycosyltransferase [Lachnospiraceae bacterium]